MFQAWRELTEKGRPVNRDIAIAWGMSVSGARKRLRGDRPGTPEDWKTWAKQLLGLKDQPARAKEFLNAIVRGVPPDELEALAARLQQKGPGESLEEESPNHSQGQDSPPQPPPLHERVGYLSDNLQRFQKAPQSEWDIDEVFRCKMEASQIVSTYKHRLNVLERDLTQQRKELNAALKMPEFRRSHKQATQEELEALQTEICALKQLLERAETCHAGFSLLLDQADPPARDDNETPSAGLPNHSPPPIEECIPPRALEALRSQGVQVAEIRSRFPKTDDAILFLIKAAIRESEHGRELIAKDFESAAKEWFIGRFPEVQKDYCDLADLFANRPFHLTPSMIEHLRSIGFPDPVLLQERLYTEPNDPGLLSFRHRFEFLKENPHHFLLQFENERLAAFQGAVQSDYSGRQRFR